MNSLIKNLSTQLIRNQRQFLIQCSGFATDAKHIEELTKKNKVVVFMKVRRNRFLLRKLLKLILLSFRATRKLPNADSPTQSFRSCACTASNTIPTTCCWTRSCGKESKTSAAGRRSRKFTSPESSSAAATFYSKCTRTANSSMCCRRMLESKARWLKSRRATRRSENRIQRAAVSNISITMLY